MSEGTNSQITLLLFSPHSHRIYTDRNLTFHFLIPTVQRLSLYSFHILRLILSSLLMSTQTTGIALIAIIYFIWKYLNRTDTPKVKNLPEIPGIPLFGNLLQFGSSHAKVAGQLAKKYGPVFQVRLGNRVCAFPCFKIFKI